MTNQPLVTGEPVTLVVRAFERFEFTEDPDGMVDARVRLEPELGLPLFRALMRVDAELLLQNANALGDPAHEERTADQWRADAFVASALRIADTGAN